MRWILSLSLLVGLAGFPQAVRAQDPLLVTIDALSTEGRCAEALALLEHARASQAALAGRRALCDVRAGHAGDVIADVAVALRSPRDPWVRAHRDALLATLSATTSTTASTTAGDSATALAAPAPAARSRGAGAPPPAPAAAPEAETSLACADAVEPNPYRAAGEAAPVQSHCGTPRTNPFHGSETIESNPYAIASWSPRDASLEPNPYFYGGPTAAGRRGDPLRPLERIDVEPNPYRPGRR